MIRRIKITNFFSIGETQEISFEISQKDILNDSAKTIFLKDEAKSKVPLNLVSCFIGSNASGKTTTLKAISFLFWIVRSSYDFSSNGLPLVFHKLMRGKPTKIEMGFLDGGSSYNYVIEFNESEILYEYLGKKNQRETCLFELVRRKEKISIKSKIKINEVDRERFEKRKNVSLLSTLLALKYITDITFFTADKMMTNVSQKGLSIYKWNSPFENFVNTSEALYGKKDLLKEVLSFSQKIDLGISDFEFREVTSNFLEEDKPDKKWLLQCVHTSPQGRSFKIDLIDESHGTQRVIYFLARVLPLLKKGGIVVLDEMDIVLHPKIARRITALFEDRNINIHNSQLIFSTHQHPLLADRTKTQIFLTEKDSQKLETEICRLDTINGVRNDENYYQKYIDNAYGANPKIN